MDNIEKNMGLLEIIATLAVIRIRFQVYLEVYEELKVTVSSEKIMSEFEVFIELCSKAKENGDFEALNENGAVKNTYELYQKLMDIKFQK